ncbi:MAG: hypothetical protein M3R52_01360, partial [Acidobacteriota bacterium]|nr:hypothetical protein [Acidobacteriota bacterium]
MKLCPQCEFIYEDDQSFCDMDGEALVYEATLGVSPAAVPAVTSAKPTKSRLRTIGVPVVTGLFLSALLFLSYCALSPLLNSNFASRSRKPEAPETTLQRQIAPPPDTSSQPATSPNQSPTNTEAASESVSVGADELSDKPASKSARSQVVPKAADNTLKASDNRLAIAR